MRRAGCENDIIYVHKQVCDGGAVMKNEQGSVTLGAMKSKGEKEGPKAKKPRARSLLEAVKRLVEATNMIQTSDVDKTSGLGIYEGKVRD